jgi:hypothetical protein
MMCHPYPTAPAPSSGLFPDAAGNRLTLRAGFRDTTDNGVRLGVGCLVGQYLPGLFRIDRQYA